MIGKALEILRVRILEFLKQQPELSVQSEIKILSSSIFTSVMHRISLGTVFELS